MDDKRLEALERRIMALEAKEEICNLMGRFAFLQAAEKYEEIADKLFSSKKTRSYEEGANGIYNGESPYGDQLVPYFLNRYDLPWETDDQNLRRGNLVVNALTSPVLKVAEDATSAVGYWITTGHETVVYPKGCHSGIPSVDRGDELPDGARYKAQWVWLKYKVEFIKEDGMWKILHMHAYDLIKCPFGEDWVSYSAREQDMDDAYLDSKIRMGGHQTLSEYPTTEHWQYKPDAFPSDLPHIE